MSAEAVHHSVTSFAQADLILLAARLMTPPTQHDALDTDVDVSALADLVDAANGGEGLLRALQATRQERLRAAPESWKREYTRLFDGVVSCPVNETGYVRRDKGVIVSDICGFYRAFGFEPDGSSGEKADHLVCELEFVAVLLIMLGEAQRGDEPDRSAIVEAALRSFLADHLAEWIASFVHRLHGATDHPVFVETGGVLRMIWDLLAARFELTHFDALGAELSEPDEPDGTPYECGMADAEQVDQFIELTGPAGTGLPVQSPAEGHVDR